MSLTDLDPTGTLSAASSAIKLVGAVLKVAPAVKNAANSSRATTAGGRGPQAAGPVSSAPVAPTKKDPERERKAYETANYVLREFGSRLCAAGLVNEHALTTALTSAAQHVDMRLFSGEANRLFASLAPKLADPLLVNSVFTSIYFIGILVAELTRSLPNYKESYTRLGPKFVQQLFRSAIGEDAFRENLGANLDAYETLATTAGLLRPTDSELKSFPNFPAFQTSRYSSRTFGDVRSNKSTYDKLCRHFERSGFPQPLRELQGDVGIIRDWRFLDGETNSRVVDVEKADKNVGENYGRVVHWLVSSADRMPPGQAIIAYHDQHVELIRWIGGRLGYALLEPARDLNMTGPHTDLNGRLKSVMNTWIILMFSEKARTARQEATARWTAERTKAAEAASKAGMVSSQPGSATNPNHMKDRRASSVQSVPRSPDGDCPAADAAPSTPGADLLQTDSSIDSQLNQINFWFNTQLKPQCQVFIKMPPTNAKARNFEARRLEDMTHRELLAKLDALEIPESHPGRAQRKAMVDQALSMLATVEAFNRANEQMERPGIARTTSATSSEVSPSLTRSSTISTASTLQSSPPYSPAAVTRRASETASFPFQEKRTTVIRRKAPPPPKKTISARALYDFAPEAGNEEELAVKEGDNLEIVEKTAALEEEGWCKAKVKGTTRIGLVPLEYLETIAAPAPSITQPVTPHQQTGSAAPVGSPNGAPPQTDVPNQAGVSSQYPMPSGKASYPQNSQPGPVPVPNVGPPGTGRKGPNKAETAKLGLAAIGATAGVATFVTTRERGAGEPEAEVSQERSATQTEISPATNSSTDQTTTESATGEATGEATTGQADASLNDGFSTTPLTTENGTADAYVPPAMDLSSIAGGQEPQYPAHQTAPLIEPQAMNQSASPFASIATPQDPYMQDPTVTGSPFAGLASPVDTCYMGRSNTEVEDETLLVTETTQDTVDDTWTETEIEIADEDASLDLI